MEEEVRPGVQLAEALELWRAMLVLRAYDERAVLSQRQGRIGAYPVFWGEEGIQASAAIAAGSEDWLFLTYRQNGLPILRGMPVEQALLYFRGDPRAFFDPRRYRCSPQAVPLATHLPHAVGWALGSRLKGEHACAIAFVGDGGSSEGDAHEAMNLASVWRVPVVFLLTNNQWAISTPLSKQAAVPHLSVRGAGYDMPSVTVDGFDALAVLEALKQALARARAGNGPSLVEAFCYRIGPHATADDPSLYRDPKQAEAWRAKEPIAQLEGILLEKGAIQQAEIEEAHEAARAGMASVGRKLDEMAPPEADWMIRGVLSGDPARLYGTTAFPGDGHGHGD
jgi:pyruvate dehydrogenase E1 component alpha subunit